MSTIMRATNPGSYDRRCDAKCHFARGPECDCLCGGRYHGAGWKEDGGFEELVEDTLEEVYEQALLRFPETVLGGADEEDEEPEPAHEPKKARSLWEIPAKRAKRW